MGCWSYLNRRSDIIFNKKRVAYETVSIRIDISIAICGNFCRIEYILRFPCCQVLQLAVTQPMLILVISMRNVVVIYLS